MVIQQYYTHLRNSVCVENTHIPSSFPSLIRFYSLLQNDLSSDPLYSLPLEGNPPPVGPQMSKFYKIYTMAECEKNVSIVKKGALWNDISTCRRGLKVKLRLIGVGENIKNPL